MPSSSSSGAVRPRASLPAPRVVEAATKWKSAIGRPAGMAGSPRCPTSVSLPGRRERRDDGPEAPGGEVVGARKQPRAGSRRSGRPRRPSDIRRPARGSPRPRRELSPSASRAPGQARPDDPGGPAGRPATSPIQTSSAEVPRTGTRSSASRCPSTVTLAERRRPAPQRRRLEREARHERRRRSGSRARRPALGSIAARCAVRRRRRLGRGAASGRGPAPPAQRKRACLGIARHLRYIEAPMKTAPGEKAGKDSTTDGGAASRPRRRHRCHPRPTQRRQIDAAQPHRRREAGHRHAQAADDAQPDHRRLQQRAPGRSSSSTRPASTAPPSSSTASCSARRWGSSPTSTPRC